MQDDDAIKNIPKNGWWRTDYKCRDVKELTKIRSDLVENKVNYKEREARIAFIDVELALRGNRN